MAEEVHSGGTKKFVWKKGEKTKIDPELEKGIESAYKIADERRKREKRNKMILIFTILAILVLIILAMVLI